MTPGQDRELCAHVQKLIEYRRILREVQFILTDSSISHLAVRCNNALTLIDKTLENDK
jgi:hypothetical protein